MIPDKMFSVQFFTFFTHICFDYHLFSSKRDHIKVRIMTRKLKVQYTDVKNDFRSKKVCINCYNSVEFYCGRLCLKFEHLNHLHLNCQQLLLYTIFAEPEQFKTP